MMHKKEKSKASDFALAVAFRKGRLAAHISTAYCAVVDALSAVDVVDRETIDELRKLRNLLYELEGRLLAEGAK